MYIEKKSIITVHYIKASILALFICLLCAAVFSSSPGYSAIAEAAAVEDLFSRQPGAYQGHNQGDAAITPLPKAERPTQVDALAMEWQLRIVSPNAPLPHDDRISGENALQAAQDYPVWLSEAPLWLFITLKPGVEGSYFYAPFAMRQSNADIARTNAAVLPTSMELLGADGATLPGAHFYYPPGAIKKDPFSSLELPVYQHEITILASYPPQYVGQDIKLKLSALICTENSCTPFRKTYAISTSASGIQTDQTDTQLALLLSSYRSSPFSDSGENAIAPASGSIAGQTSATMAEPDRAQPAPESEFSDYLSQLQPHFYQKSLEVENIGRAVLLGLLAGLILNFMPCVLPVITLKIGTLLGLGGWSRLSGDNEAAARGRRRFRLYAFCFSLGIFAWFGLLFGVIGLAGMMWGQFFQSQSLVLGLTLLLFIMSLGLLGLLRLPVLHAEISTGKSLPWQAFFGGLLATLLATPCSGPLLGGVLGWAVNQSAAYLGLTLASVALGMASPFLLMVVNPNIAKRLPQPGPWAKNLEIIMGFVLIGTALYLLSLLPQNKQIATLAACLALAFCAWVWKQAKTSRRAALARIILAVLALCAIYMPFIHNPADTGWKKFDPAHFSRQLGQRNLLLDFTADWCINCRAMEMTTLTEQRLAAWAKSYDLVYIKVDLTTPEPDGEALLQAMGSASMPLIAIIPATEPSRPTVLRDIVTPSQLDAALRQALSK